MATTFVKPDYTFGRLEAYKSVALGYLIDRQDPQILSAVQHRRNVSQEWPSWVPDWDIWTTRDLKRPGRSADCNTSDQIAKDRVRVAMTKHNDQDALLLRGIRVDTVTSVVSRSANWSENPPLRKSRQKETTHAEDLRLAWTATGGLHFDTGELLKQPDDEAHQLEGFRLSLNPPKRIRSTAGTNTTQDEYSIFDSSSPADRFLARAQQVLTGRNWFKTSRGMFGIGPNSMYTKDVVVIVFGCNVPLVLALVNVKEDRGFVLPVVYRIVGECYLHEIMDGQAVEEWERSGKEADEFLVI